MKISFILSAIALTTSTNSYGYMSEKEVVEQFQEKPSRTIKETVSKIFRPLLNKRDTKLLFGNMKSVDLSLMTEAASQGIDLRTQASPVKNQGSEGLCTAFATVAALESIAKSKSKLLDLSERQHWNTYRQYSMMASTEAATEYWISNETDWPYAGKQVKKNDVALGKDRAMLMNLNQVMFQLQNKKPVVFATETTQYWNNPKGVIPTTGKKGGGHAILIEGYQLNDKVSGGGYLIVKNSWGANYGDKGYIYIPFGYCKNFYCSFIVINDVLLK